MKKGCPYGTHRVISPKGVLPQPADVIDNTMEIYDNEVLIDVKTLNIDSASFTEIVRRVLDKKPAEVTTKEEMDKIGAKMMEIVAHAGKHKTLGPVPAECFSEQLNRLVLHTLAT